MLQRVKFFFLTLTLKTPLADVIGEFQVYVTKHLGGGIHDLLKGTITQGRDELILLHAGHEVCRPP